jgi:hypothetical protein
MATYANQRNYIVEAIDFDKTPQHKFQDDITGETLDLVLKLVPILNYKAPQKKTFLNNNFKININD